MVCENLYKRWLKGYYHYDPITGMTTDWWNFGCGKCTSCKIQKAKEWALRCTLELPYWDKSIFTTLTYDDEHLPENGSVSKAELQEFFDKLRDKLKPTGQKIKTLACTEYGENSNRAHAHAIIFGIGLNEDDWYYSFKNGKQNICYRSENRIIENCWNKGEVYNGYVTYNSSRYVASYVFKKYYDKMAEDVYLKNGLENPDQIESKGFGLKWWQDYGGITIQRGYIMLNGVKQSIPRYFLKQAKKEGRDETIKSLQTKHALDKYKIYLKENNIILPEKNPLDSFNEKLLKRMDERSYGLDYNKWLEEQNILAGKQAEHKNKLFF